MARVYSFVLFFQRRGEIAIMMAVQIVPVARTLSKASMFGRQVGRQTGRLTGRTAEIAVGLVEKIEKR